MNQKRVMNQRKGKVIYVRIVQRMIRNITAVVVKRNSHTITHSSLDSLLLQSTNHITILTLSTTNSNSGILSISTKTIKRVSINSTT